MSTKIEKTLPVRCGRCGGDTYHPSVAAVRFCFNGGAAEVVTRTGSNVATDFNAPFVRPTPNQLKYVKALLNQRGLIYLPGIETISKTSISEKISRLRTAVNGEWIGKDYAGTEIPAYCESPECLGTAAWWMNRIGTQYPTAHCDDHKRVLSVDADNKTSFSALRMAEQKDAEVSALSAPKAKGKGFNPETLEDGFYVRDDNVYKVVVAHYGSGRKYAKVLDKDTGEWEMAREAIRNLRPEHKMSLQQALEVAKAQATNPESRLYGRCFKCGRVLTLEESIARFMGQTCADSFA